MKHSAPGLSHHADGSITVVCPLCESPIIHKRAQIHRLSPLYCLAVEWIECSNCKEITYDFQTFYNPLAGPHPIP